MATIFSDVRIVDAMLHGGWERAANTWRLSGRNSGNENRDVCVEWHGAPQDLPSEAQIIIWYDEWVVIDTQKIIDAQLITSRIDDINDNGATKIDFDNAFNTLGLLRNFSSSIPSIDTVFTTLRTRIGQKPAYLTLTDNFIESVYDVVLPIDPETATDSDKRVWVQGAWQVVLTLALESTIGVILA